MCCFKRSSFSESFQQENLRFGKKIGDLFEIELGLSNSKNLLDFTVKFCGQSSSSLLLDGVEQVFFNLSCSLLRLRISVCSMWRHLNVGLLPVINCFSMVST